MQKLIFILILLTGATSIQAQPLRIALLKYSGGGDWYADPTALPNLITYCNQHLNTTIHAEPSTVEVGSPEIFNFPFVHMTGN